MNDSDIRREIIDTVRGKIRDGEIPQHIKDYAQANARSETSGAALKTWMRGQRMGAGSFVIGDIINRAMGDELLRRRLDDWQKQWHLLVIEQMIEEEFNLLVQSGELVRETNDDGEEFFFPKPPNEE